ncbi:MAG: SIS domain-containing protein [Candidatus Promineifilaceae bacterium]|nr:SIS domain-containing protein [Candidatus Promineifilaceae bacterium]
MEREIESLPQLLDHLGLLLANSVEAATTALDADNLDQILLTGCGDSHHVGLAAALAFRQLVHVPTSAVTSMQCARFMVSYLPHPPSRTLVVTVSSSGKVSRTMEALELANQAGAQTLAVTKDPASPLGRAADVVFVVPELSKPKQPRTDIFPGTHSLIGSLMALFHLAVQLAVDKRQLKATEAQGLRAELTDLTHQTQNVLEGLGATVADAARRWLKSDCFVFCGCGPALGSAHAYAAKLVEAAGDLAVVQDLEEWAHLQYFGRQADTPTFLISSGERDADRLQEVSVAAKAIGRRVVIVTPQSAEMFAPDSADWIWSVSRSVRDCFSSALTVLPGLLFASERSSLLKEPYFRAFSGGRSREGGGGISRIQSSRRWPKLPDN